MNPQALNLVVGILFILLHNRPCVVGLHIKFQLNILNFVAIYGNKMCKFGGKKIAKHFDFTYF